MRYCSLSAGTSASRWNSFRIPAVVVPQSNRVARSAEVHEHGEGADRELIPRDLLVRQAVASPPARLAHSRSPNAQERRERVIVGSSNPKTPSWAGADGCGQHDVVQWIRTETVVPLA